MMLKRRKTIVAAIKKETKVATLKEIVFQVIQITPSPQIVAIIILTENKIIFYQNKTKIKLNPIKRVKIAVINFIKPTNTIIILAAIKEVEKKMMKV